MDVLSLTEIVATNDSIIFLFFFSIPYFSPKEVVLGWWSFLKNSAHINEGPCSQVRSCRTLHSASHWCEWKFSGAWACRITFKLFQPLKSCIQRFKILWQALMVFFWKLPHFPPTNAIFWGHGFGGPWLKSLYFCYLGAHKRIRYRMMSPSGIYWNPNIFVSEEPM